MYSTLIEPQSVGITRLDVSLEGLPAGLDGLTIAHLTDLHRSSLVSSDYLRRCIMRANALTPDVIVFTGDYLTHPRSRRGDIVYGHAQGGAQLMADSAECLGRARARHGVFASLGNHDHWFDADLVSKLIERAGVTVLRNQSTTLTIRGAPLPVVGLGDLWTEGVDFRKAFAGIAGTPSIVLMHNPDSFERWSQPGSHLILAGHTHGGQINLPVLGAPIVPSLYGQKYARGLFRRDNSLMYVNRGLGVVWPGVRFNCRPEIALFRLHSA